MLLDLIVRRIPKSKFTLVYNNTLVEEPFAVCSLCGRKNHKICAMYHENVFGKYNCSSCRKDPTERDKKLETYGAKSGFCH